MAHHLDRFALFYPMRIVGAIFLIVVTTLYGWQFDGFDAFYFVLVAVLAVHPHVVQHIARKYPLSRLKIETRAFLVDSFLLGLAVESTGFTPLPTFVLITVALVNALAVNGFGLMLRSALALAAGIATPLPFAGAIFAPKDAIAIDVTCAAFMFVYFMAFAYSSYNRNALLLASQEELREQKAFLEIEKLRSDHLLLNLVPADLAAEMELAAGIRPTAFDPVTLVAIELRGLSRALREHEPHSVLAHLMHCFQAFDAIVGRHGLEKLKTMGDIYIAVAGLPKAAPADAASGVEAALEVREFLADLAESRRAHGEFTLDSRVSVHTGAVIGGIVETAKISYDLWGHAMKALLCLLRATPDGAMAISEATRAQAGERFEWARAGEADCGGASAVACYTAQRRTA